MHLAPVRVAPPETQPVSVAELKTHLRIDSAESDAELTMVIASAISRVDGWSGTLGRCLIRQVWRQDYSCFPACDRIVLPFPSVTATEVKYSDTSNAEQTLSASDYSLHETAAGTVLVLAGAASWPSVYDRADAVRIAMTVGYGLNADDVPAQIRWAIMMLAADLWRNREAGSASDDATAYADRITHPFRRTTF